MIFCLFCRFILVFFCVFVVYCRVLFCYILMNVDCFGLVVSTWPLSVWPHLFCGAGHKKRRGEQLKWSLAFTLCIGSFPCAQLPGAVHTARLGRVCFFKYMFSLGLCFAYLFVLFDLFVSPFFVFPWAVELESSPLQFLALA